MVDVYITLTEFARQKFIQGGMPAEKIVVKPNFVYPDPGLGKQRERYALFVGRLSREKGVETLLTAWKHLEDYMPLKIVGNGPLADEVTEATRRIKGVEWLGRQAEEQVLALMKEAYILLVPSLCYESFPRVIVEAYATGLPVVGGNLGGISSLIKPAHTGLHFQPGSPENLATQVRWALAHPMQVARMRQEARAEFEAKYTAERNWQVLKRVYERIIVNRRPRQ
jgi:glycosyltransferase involved in cell wall biosynthesis